MVRYKPENTIPNIIQERNTELANLGREFLRWLEVKNYTGIDSFQRTVNFFLLWCEGREIYNSEQLNVGLIAEYEKYLLTAKSASGEAFTQYRRRAYLSKLAKFCKWMLEQDALYDNPAVKIVYPKVSKRQTKNICTHNEIEEIISQANIQTPLGIRDRAIMETLYSSGLRRVEVSKLTPGDVDLNNGTITVSYAKGGKSRVVPVGQRACMWIKKYLLEVRPLLCGEKQPQNLFLGSRNDNLKTETMTKIIREYVRKTGKNGACHLFRHAMATQIFANGASLSQVQQMLGHEQISTTQIYTHIEIEQLQHVHQQTHPTGREQVSPVRLSPPTLGKTGVMNKTGSQNKDTLPKNEIGLAISQYLQSLQLSDYAAQTISGRKRELRAFAFWCQQRSIEAIAQLSRPLLEMYNSYLKNKRNGNKKDNPLKVSSIQKSLCNLKYFFAYLAEQKIISNNFAAKLELPRVNKCAIIQVLTPAEVNAILQQPDITTALGIRDRAILETLYSTGIHCKELIALNVQDVNFANSTLFIAFSKGRRERIIPISPSALYWIEQYLLLVRPQFTQDCTQLKLFLGQFGFPLGARTFANRIKDYFQAAHVHKAVGFQIFRRSMATAMLDNGADLRYVQQILGHTNASHTQIYAKFAIRKLKEVHTQTHPAKLKTSSQPPNSSFGPPI